MSVLDEIRPEWDALKEAVKDVVALNAELCAEVKRLRKYTRTLESANLDVTARLQDYIGQYDPTDAFVAEVKAENAKLRELVRSYESLTAAMCNERDCAGCPFDSTAHVLCEHMRLAACMGELGIEVGA